MGYKKNDLTNEQLKGRYRSQFDLTNKGIDIARSDIEHEQETTLNHVLDQLTEIPKEQAE